MTEGKDFKGKSAEIIADLLSDERVRRGLKYFQGEEFRSERDRVRQEASRRLKDIRERYRSKRRTPEAAAREKELTLRLAEVEGAGQRGRILLRDVRKAAR